MWKLAVRIGYGLLGLTAVCALGGLAWDSGALNWAAVVFATAAYHIFMRSLVGNACFRIMHNRANVRSFFFRVRPWEERLYQRLRIRKWKNKLPTNDPATFDPHRHSWEEIAQTTCQSEVVHESNLVLSFLPLALGRRAFGFFLTTGLLAAVAETPFIMIQRYNRARMVRLAERQRLSAEGKKKERCH